MKHSPARYALVLLGVLLLIQYAHCASLETPGTLKFLQDMRAAFPTSLSSWPIDNDTYCSWGVKTRVSCDAMGWVTMDIGGLVPGGLVAADGATLPEVTTDDVLMRYISMTVNTTTPLTAPASWSRMTLLITLQLSGGLTGTLPDSWSNLTSLEIFYLINCDFSGTLPAAWSALNQLKEFYIPSGGNLSGTLPDSWSNMTLLETLVVAQASVTGTLPASWRSMSKIRLADFSDNNLNGTLPMEWMNFSKLFFFAVENNHLSGTLPNWNTSKMQFIYLSNNSFTGTLPAIWSTWDINIITLSGNRFCGCEPDSWKNVTALHTAAASQTPTSWVNCSLVNSCTPLPTLVLDDEDGASAHLSTTLAVLALTAVFASLLAL